MLEIRRPSPPLRTRLILGGLGGGGKIFDREELWSLFARALDESGLAPGRPTVLFVCDTPHQGRLTGQLARRLRPLGANIIAGICDSVYEIKVGPVCDGEEVPSVALDDGFDGGGAARDDTRERVMLSLPTVSILTEKLLPIIDLVVVFNDNSGTASAVARAAKRASIPVAAVQDGSLLAIQSRWARIGASRVHLERLERLLMWVVDIDPGIRHFIQDQYFSDRGFGRTRPDRLFVAGEATRRKLMLEQLLPRDRFIISGLLGAKASDLRRHRKPAVSPADGYVLLVDQPLVENEEVPFDTWVTEMTALLAALRPYPLAIRPHPSGSRAQIERLRSMAEDGVVFLDGPPAASLEGASLVITYFSTMAFDALAQGRPGIIYSLPGVKTCMPPIASPLVRNIDRLDVLRAALAAWFDVGEFAGNRHGYRLSDILSGDQPERVISEGLADMAWQSFRRG